MSKRIEQLKRRVLRAFSYINNPMPDDQKCLDEIQSILSESDKPVGGEYRISRPNPDVTVCVLGPGGFKQYCDDDFAANELAKVLNTLSTRIKELLDIISDGFCGYKESIEKPLLIALAKLAATRKNDGVNRANLAQKVRKVAKNAIRGKTISGEDVVLVNELLIAKNSKLKGRVAELERLIEMSPYSDDIELMGDNEKLKRRIKELVGDLKSLSASSEVDCWLITEYKEGGKVLTAKNESLTAENSKLKERVGELEKINHSLEGDMHQVEGLGVWLFSHPELKARKGMLIYKQAIAVIKSLTTEVETQKAENERLREVINKVLVKFNAGRDGDWFDVSDAYGLRQALTTENSKLEGREKITKVEIISQRERIKDLISDHYKLTQSLTAENSKLKERVGELAIMCAFDGVITLSRAREIIGCDMTEARKLLVEYVDDHPNEESASSIDMRKDMDMESLTTEVETQKADNKRLTSKYFEQSQKLIMRLHQIEEARSRRDHYQQGLQDIVNIEDVSLKEIRLNLNDSDRWQQALQYAHEALASASPQGIDIKIEVDESLPPTTFELRSGTQVVRAINVGSPRGEVIEGCDMEGPTHEMTSQPPKEKTKEESDGMV